jgi:hypothetical protein
MTWTLFFLLWFYAWGMALSMMLLEGPQGFKGYNLIRMFFVLVLWPVWWPVILVVACVFVIVANTTGRRTL